MVISVENGGISPIKCWLGVNSLCRKVQVGKDQEKAQSAKDSHSKSPRWKKTKLTTRYLYHENIS